MASVETVAGTSLTPKRKNQEAVGTDCGSYASISHYFGYGALIHDFGEVEHQTNRSLHTSGLTNTHTHTYIGVMGEEREDREGDHRSVMKFTVEQVCYTHVPERGIGQRSKKLPRVHHGCATPCACPTWQGTCTSSVFTSCGLHLFFGHNSPILAFPVPLLLSIILRVSFCRQYVHAHFINNCENLLTVVR